MLPDLRIGGGQTLLLENIRTLDAARFHHTVCYLRPREEMAQRFRAAGGSCTLITLVFRAFPARRVAGGTGPDVAAVGRAAARAD